jgi:hypothetical protein
MYSFSHKNRSINNSCSHIIRHTRLPLSKFPHQLIQSRGFWLIIALIIVLFIPCSFSIALDTNSI